jgi:hypothetical protein
VPAAAVTPGADDEDHDGDIVLAGRAQEMHQRWAVIQSSFVDNPRGSVEDAAEFLDEMMTTVLARARQRERDLRGEWDADGVDTEGLRTILRRYRVLVDLIAAL